MPTVLECAHPGCERTFTRRTCQKYCTPECRIADRRCCACRVSLPPDQPGTKNNYCRACQAEQARQRRSDPRRSVQAVASVRAKKYGLSAQDYLALYDQQEGRCAICHEAETARTNRGGTETRTLAVDHDHTSGVVRGLLCTRCNTGMGLFGDDPHRLASAIEYLEATDE